MEDTVKYRDFYLQTANDYLIGLKATLNQLKQNPNYQPAQKETHIAWHSLKSQSDFMGYKSLALFCHVLELYFNDVLNGQKQLTESQMPLVENAVSILESSLNQIKSVGTENDITEKTENLKTKLGGVL